MKKVTIAGILVGLMLGCLQLAFPYIRTTSNIQPFDPQVGSCEIPLNKVGDNCVGDGRNFYRGWPLANQGVVGIGDSFHNPPTTGQTYANVAILAIATPLLFVLVSIPLGKLKFSKKQWCMVFAAAAIGAGLGIGQLFIVTKELRPTTEFDMRQASSGCEDQKVAGCGYCPAEQLQGNYCTYPPHEQEVRGWPWRHDTYTSISKYDVAPKLIANFAVITAGSAAAGMVLAAVAMKPTKSNKRRTKK